MLLKVSAVATSVLAITALILGLLELHPLHAIVGSLV
jgi:hypothetical protein